MEGFFTDITERKSFEKEREELIPKLQNALNEIKTLRGIIPVCSHCKKIRDDKGYWNQIEIYIEKHSNAHVSHGVCPDCAASYYGHTKWFKKQQSSQPGRPKSKD